MRGGKHYCETMKNITVSVDDSTYRKARIRAAEAGRSVSALVRDYLNGIATEKSREEELHEQELRLRERIERFSAADRMPRDALHERKA